MDIRRAPRTARESTESTDEPEAPASCVRIRAAASATLLPNLAPPHPASVLFDRRRVIKDGGRYRLLQAAPDAE
jgi:hypothetical protein